MKKIWRKMLLMVCTLLLVLPVTVFAGFNIGGMVGSLGGKKPSVPSANTGSGTIIISGTVFAEWAPLQQATVYIGRTLKVEVTNNTVVINGECHRETATDDNGKFSCGFENNGPHDMVIWKHGYAPIVKHGIITSGDLGKMSTSTEGAANTIQFNN